MNVMNGPICRQVEYIIVSNNIMIMSLLAYMLRMLLVIAYMLVVPMYMIHVVPELIVLVVMRNMSLRNVLLIVFMNMLAVSACADA